MELKDIIDATPCDECGGHGYIIEFHDLYPDLELEGMCIKCGGSGRTYIASNAIELLAKEIAELKRGDSAYG